MFWGSFWVLKIAIFPLSQNSQKLWGLYKLCWSWNPQILHFLPSSIAESHKTQSERRRNAAIHLFYFTSCANEEMNLEATSEFSGKNFSL